MTKPIGSDFTPIHAKLKRRCSECSTVIEKGGPSARFNQRREDQEGGLLGSLPR
jgi:hypothetical protein